MNYAHIFFFSSRRRHTRLQGDWSSDVCSSDLAAGRAACELSAGTGNLGAAFTGVTSTAAIFNCDKSRGVVSGVGRTALLSSVGKFSFARCWLKSGGGAIGAISGGSVSFGVLCETLATGGACGVREKAIRLGSATLAAIFGGSG